MTLVRISYEHSNVFSPPDVILLSETVSNYGNFCLTEQTTSTSSPPLYVRNFFYSGATRGSIHTGCTDSPRLSSFKLRNLRLAFVQNKAMEMKAEEQ